MITQQIPKLFKFLLLILWMLVIYVFSDQPNSNETTLEIFGTFNYWVRKAAHMTEYGILFLLFYIVLAPDCSTKQVASGTTGDGDTPIDGQGNDDLAINESTKRVHKTLLLSFLLTVAYAGSDEWHQSFVLGRSALLSDVLIDASGASIAALILYLASKLQRR